MSLIDDVVEIVSDIIDKDMELEMMSDNWNSGSPEDAAMSDPGLQYEISEQIDRKLRELRDLLVARL